MKRRQGLESPKGNEARPAACVALRRDAKLSGSRTFRSTSAGGLAIAGTSLQEVLHMIVRNSKHWLLRTVLLLCSVALMFCTNPMSNSPIEDREDVPGTLVVDIAPLASKTLVPDLDMTPAEYRITGSGPEEQSFSETTQTPPLTIPGLRFGDWTVSVEALNADGILIGRCQEVVRIRSGITVTFSAVLRPLEGNGSLDLTVTWPQADTENPVVRGQLVASDGQVLVLEFTISAPGRAVCARGDIAAGYYTLVIQLYDQLASGDQLAMGAVVMARILHEQTTYGAFDFPEINDPPGDLEVSITPEMADPIAVSLSGQAAEIDEGGSMSVTASVPPDSGEVLWAWYLNGASVGAGSSITVGASLEPGVYRLDVTVSTSDGSRAGSAACSFRVNEVAVAQATLIWDPNSETDLAGYKLHYGQSSGSYSAVVDVGNTTTYTLTDLEPGRTYYVAATAYCTEGLESGYSNEVVFTGS